MGAAHGWERPNWFSDAVGDVADETFHRTNWFPHVAREVDATNTRVAMADLSVFSKFDVSGPDTIAFLDTIGANRAPRPGRIGLNHALTAAGGVLSEFTVAMLDETQAYLTSAAAAEEIDFDLLQDRAADFNTTIRNVTEELGVFSLMGPQAAKVMQNVVDQKQSDFPWLSVREITVSGISVRVLRISYIGEAGWEFHVPADDAAQLFTAIETAAKPYGLGFYGAFAADSMRIEKGFRAWGSELTVERSPIEAGLGAFVKADGRDFSGKDAMLARENPWDMVLLDIEAGEVDPFYAHTVWQNDTPVGTVTSGAYGHRTGKTLALAYLRDSSARTGLSVNILGEHRAAHILDRPPFDPDNTRLRN